MTSELGEDVWGDEDFLNALILATENASAASSSSAPTSTARISPYKRKFSDASLPPPPRPVRVASRAPPPVSLSSNGTQAPWQEWDDFFADGNLELFDFGFDSRACNFSPPRELSQRVSRTESKSLVEDVREANPNTGSPKNSLRKVRAEKDKDKQLERLKVFFVSFDSYHSRTCSGFLFK